jgi:hypothetical protein
MMRCNTFARSAVFAAGAATAWLPWLLVVAPVAGASTARVCYLVGVTAVYIAGLSPQGRRRITVALAAAIVGAVIAFVAHTTVELAIGLAAIVGVARSGFFYRAAPARAVATEVTLLIGGLLFARFLAGASLPATALSIWGFFLVQSLFFLVAGVRARPASGSHPDPFEEAHRRALALLEQTSV